MNPFLWLSGVNKEVLARCPAEKTKFVGVGGAVLTTAVFATAACTLTLHNFLDLDLSTSLLVGLVWGLMILNLDRWLVASMKRQKGLWANLGVALPRIALALIIGTVIAEPLLLKVFDVEISKKAVEIKQEQVAERRKALDTAFAKIPDLQTRHDQLTADLTAVSTAAALDGNARYQEVKTGLDALQAKLDAAESAVICENEGTCGSGKTGRGPAYAEKVALRDQLRGEVDAKKQEANDLATSLITEEQTARGSQHDAKQQELDATNAEIKRLTVERDTSERDFVAATAVAPGLLDRIEALGALSAENSSMNSAQWALRLLIIALDSLPVLVKTMLSLGKPSLYDLELEQWEQRTRDENADEDARAARDRDRQTRMAEADAAAQAQQAETIARRCAAIETDAILELQDRFVQAWKVQEAERLDREAAAQSANPGPRPTNPTSTPPPATTPIPAFSGTTPSTPPGPSTPGGASSTTPPRSWVAPGGGPRPHRHRSAFTQRILNLFG